MQEPMQFATMAETMPANEVSWLFTPAAYAIAIRAKVTKLREDGHLVEPQDIPGLWRVDGGPEITTGQLLSLTV